MIATWLALAVVGAWAPEQTVDEFVYSDAAAQQAWRPSEGTPPVEVVADGSRSVLRLRGDFATRPAKRTVIDRQAELDLAAPGAFTLEVLNEAADAGGQLTLYFRSGKGWYGAGATLAKGLSQNRPSQVGRPSGTEPPTGSGTGSKKEGWQTLRIAKSSFRTEGEPAGWNRIDGIRIALWRDGERDVAIRLRRLAGVCQPVAVLVPDAAKEDKESKTATETAKRIGDFLDELGLGSDQIEVGRLAGGALGQRPVAIVAYCPHFDEPAVASLVQYVQGGGKLVLCYQLPSALGKVLGFKQVKWAKPERPGQLAEIRFSAPDVTGLPEAVRQASWNITVAEPAGEGARVLGQWYDDQGQATGYAGMLLSNQGAFLSHILLGDDAVRKKQLLAAVLGHLHPGLWRQMAEASLAGVGRVGHLGHRQEVEDYIQAQDVAAATQKLAAARTACSAAQTQFEQGRFAESIAAARQAQELYVAAYLLGQPSHAIEGRAMWNHSGTGAYPGDWERTAKLLAENGFNMILPNMLWGGVAHYASDVLPRSETFRQYGDQIQQCVAAANKHGLEVHVWKVNWNLGHAVPKSFVEQLRQQGRLMATVAGEEQPWLCPSHPENQKLELDSLLEVVRKYDVHGIHFDYIRYPGPHVCFCSGCRQRFEQESGRKLSDWPAECHTGSRREEYIQWRCDQITKLVAAVHREAKRLRPEVKISAAVFSAYPSCQRSVFQDWVHWVQAGYLDFLCPMDYQGSDARFCDLVENQLRLVEGKIPIYPGIGATASRVRLSADRVVGQIHHARRLGAAGFTIFNLSEGTAKEIVPGVGQGATAHRATLPHAKVAP